MSLASGTKEEAVPWSPLHRLGLSPGFWHQLPTHFLLSALLTVTLWQKDLSREWIGGTTPLQTHLYHVPPSVYRSAYSSPSAASPPPPSRTCQGSGSFLCVRITREIFKKQILTLGLGGGPRVCISAGLPGAAASQGCATPPQPPGILPFANFL